MNNMRVYRKAYNQILEKIKQGLASIPEEEVTKFVDTLVTAKKNSKRIFLIGAGRSGLVAKTFGMRLVHLKMKPYIIGETITRPLRQGDVVIAISGSGRTTSVVTVTKKAKELGGQIIGITSNPGSPLGKLADLVIHIKAKRDEEETDDYLVRQLEGKTALIAPLGTLFELSTMIFLDCIVSELAEKLGVNEEDMKIRHTNLE